MNDEHEQDGAVDPEQAELERLLLRSAKLDVPSSSARERALSRGLAVVGARKSGGARRWVAAGGLTLAVAAAVTLLVRHGSERSTEVAPERIRSVASTHAVATASAPVPVEPPPCVALVVAKGDAPLIEDFEHEDSRVLERDGRQGNWITYDDGTGTQAVPSRSPLFPSRIPGARGASKRALHMMGGHFTDWGVTFGVELADAACYDASAYGGIEFWAKGPGQIRVGLQVIDVLEQKHGGFCQANCYNTHKKVIDLSPTFRKYVVRWQDLKQLYVAGPAVAFDPRRIRQLEFGIAPENTPFDVWIDDVSFIPR
jgi:hypothetical protein